MDDRRFDALTRAMGTGQNRRQVLRGLLGLGGGAVALTSVLPADAARRRRSTPPPEITCPGQQIPSGDMCVCPGDLEKCGPDCCPPGIAECCDNACCYGTCYGEELCCPTPNIVCNGECVEGVCCNDNECPPYQVCTGDHLCCIPSGGPTGGILGQTCLNDDCCSGSCNPLTGTCI